MSTFSEERKHQFLEALRKSPNVTVAARKVGISTSTVAKHRKDDPLFEERFQEALNEAIDMLEHNAHQRAFQGVEKGVYYKGDLVDTQLEYSDALTMFLLKAHRPEKYRERSQVDSNVTGGMTLRVVTGVPIPDTDDLV